jgi:hypothetical protein
VQPAGLIVQSSFTSARDMAAHHFPLVPRALVRTRLDSLARSTGMRCPKLFVPRRPTGGPFDQGH